MHNGVQLGPVANKTNVMLHVASRVVAFIEGVVLGGGVIVGVGSFCAGLFPNRGSGSQDD